MRWAPRGSGASPSRLSAPERRLRCSWTTRPSWPLGSGCGERPGSRQSRRVSRPWPPSSPVATSPRRATASASWAAAATRTLPASESAAGAQLEDGRRRVVGVVLGGPLLADLDEAGTEGGGHRGVVVALHRGSDGVVGELLASGGDDRLRQLTTVAVAERVVAEPVVEVQGPRGHGEPDATPPDEPSAAPLLDGEVAEAELLPVQDVGGQSLGALLRRRHARGSVLVGPRVGVQRDEPRKVLRHRPAQPQVLGLLLEGHGSIVPRRGRHTSWSP